MVFEFYGKVIWRRFGYQPPEDEFAILALRYQNWAAIRGIEYQEPQNINDFPEEFLRDDCVKLITMYKLWIPLGTALEKSERHSIIEKKSDDGELKLFIDENKNLFFVHHISQTGYYRFFNLYAESIPLLI